MEKKENLQPVSSRKRGAPPFFRVKSLALLKKKDDSDIATAAALLKLSAQGPYLVVFIELRCRNRYRAEVETALHTTNNQ